MCPDKENFVTKTKVLSFSACFKKKKKKKSVTKFQLTTARKQNRTKKNNNQPNEQVFVSTVSPLRKPTWLMYT